MPEIGSTLRETRMRQRIDITDMEHRTKIRAKYLRALENEEWDLLPGPTYVRSFLRTYAEALGLDAKALVEEYKLRHDPLETGELHPIRPPGRDRRRRPEPRGGMPRGTAVGAVLLLILVALFLIGRGGDDEDPRSARQAAPPATDERRDEPARRRRPARPRVVRLTVAPTAVVWVCLVDAGGQRRIPGTEIAPGPPRTFHSRRFRITLGNGNIRLRVNGRVFQPPQSAEPQGFEFSRSGRRALGEDERPTCAGTT